MKSCPVASPLVVAILLGSWLGSCIQQAYRLPGDQKSDAASPVAAPGGRSTWRKKHRKLGSYAIYKTGCSQFGATGVIHPLNVVLQEKTIAGANRPCRNLTEPDIMRRAAFACHIGQRRTSGKSESGFQKTEASVNRRTTLRFRQRRSRLRGLAVHRSRPRCLSDINCPSVAVSR